MTEGALLAQWIEEGDAIVTRVTAGAGAGVMKPDTIADMTGLQVMEAMLQGVMPVAPMAQTLAFGAISVAPGKAIFQGTPQPEFLNPMGTIHGGWMGTLLDSALGSAVMTSLPPQCGYVTAGLNIQYLKPVTPRIGRVRVEANVTALDMERGHAKAEAFLYGPDGMQYATATADFKLRGARRV